MALASIIIQPVVFRWPAKFLSLQDRGTAWAITPETAQRIALEEAELLGPSRLVSIDSLYVDSDAAPMIDVPGPRESLPLQAPGMLQALRRSHPDVATALMSPVPLRGSGGDLFHFHVAYCLWHWQP